MGFYYYFLQIWTHLCIFYRSFSFENVLYFQNKKDRNAEIVFVYFAHWQSSLNNIYLNQPLGL